MSLWPTRVARRPASRRPPSSVWRRLPSRSETSCRGWRGNSRSSRGRFAERPPRPSGKGRSLAEGNLRLTVERLRWNASRPAAASEADAACDLEPQRLARLSNLRTRGRDMNSEQQQAGSPRREFLKTTAAVAGGALAGHGTSWGFHHGVDQSLKVGLIGCGGRGTGAAMNAAQADPDVQITALCDVFADRIASCRTALQTQLGARRQVDDAHCFDGLEGYQKLIDSGVDVVLLCSTPYFRPDHMEAAVKAKKHIFCEKPIATDVAGSLRVLKACEAAAADDLNVVSGLCWRYDPAVLEVMRRIKDGAIGEIRAIQENYLTGTLWHRGNRPEWSPLEYQLRNWLYFTWLSGDLIAEQHIHSLDKSLWLMDDQPPALLRHRRATGSHRRKVGRHLRSLRLLLRMG